MATFSALGVGSGLDLASMLEDLMKLERKPLERLQEQVSSFNTKISALGTLGSKLSALQTAAKNLRPATLQSELEKFATYSGQLGDDKIGKVTVGEGAGAGTYELVVDHLARGQKTILSRTTTDGTLEIEFPKATDRNFSISVTAGNSLEDTAKAINARNAGVSATVINGKELVLTGEEGTDNEFKVKGDAFDTAKTTPPENAQLWIDGIEITSQGNKITNALTGVTLDLTATTSVGNPTTLTIAKNSEDKLKSSLEAFVKAFNDAAASINSLGAYDAETKVAGALQGNSLLRETQSALSKLVFDIKLGESTLSSIGINFKGTDGTLALDADKLKNAVATDPEAVAKFAAEVGKVFDTKLDEIVGVGGRVQLSKESMQSSISSLEKQQEALEFRLDKVEERYRTQFSALDTLVADLTGTSSWLTQTLASLPTSYGPSAKK